ncbi:MULTISPECIES: ectoine synthase [Gordonia]|uniref:L-ectoine synthase n=1 Tax=Gordonia sputi NBRC 100414 TaxID=1089453 RepID=H5TZC4_9ACTN|nr:MULTISPECIES: ectoine synthase [Gordonia]MCM3893673.1 ectoine synthase [Gordonia sputi]NKY93982.1 ectoine synthase [Gordonia sputi]OBA42219.1 L-ectoine synthase [Gordonia sp. 852002-51296_SCH5728562-b]OBC08270.1 L-ectoine synthase [Gordonia sp. 852002-50395_SCH5434458]GAB38832.1 L-ectoine synthase [Gordonia sputi NBRC 100414]
MIVRTTNEITGTEREVADPKGNWVSKRIVLGGDGVGFSFHETTIKAGSVNEFHYANHIEAVWLVEGEGTLLDRETGQTYPLAAGSMYLLNGHERHTVTAETQMRMLCVFNPPVVGTEVHDENGIYPLVTVPEQPNGKHANA